MKKQITTAVIVEGRDGKFLGVSRKYDYNSWGFGGGKCNVGESPVQCAFRELKEETGLSAISLFCVDVRDYVNKTVEPNTLDEVHCFVVTSFHGNLHSEDYLIEHGEGMVKWVTVEELKAGAFGDYNVEILKKLYNL